MRIKVKELTAENFAPYGQIIDLNKSGGGKSEGSIDYWPKYAITTTPPQAGILEIRKTADSRITNLERHLLYDEVFIPVDGMAIMPFAPAADLDNLDAKPDVSTLEAFLIDGTKAMVIKKGVWHYPAKPITDAIRFFMIVSEECSADLYDKEITPVEVEL